MKRLFALLLVLVMVVGLMAACGKKPEPTDPTTTTGGSANATDPTTTTKPEKPWKGKELQLYGGYSPASYGNPAEKMNGEGNYLWMIHAAICEWAAINEVTIVNKGSYNVNAIFAAVHGGDHPDLCFVGHSTFPASANYGITAAWTDEEYKSLCESLDLTMYVDMLEHQGKKYGVLYPWTGASMIYYNKTIFEETGTKTPKEYFLEGKWDWDAFKACLEGVSKDLDGDGVFDYVGFPSDSWLGLKPPYSIDEKGALTMDCTKTQFAFDFIELKYEYMYQKKFIISSTNQIQSRVTYPMYAMQLSDCEPYNWKHCFQAIKNGHELEVVPEPVYKSKDGKESYASTAWTQSGMFMLNATDEREATLSLVKYILECGQKYCEMLSNGVVKTKFKGLTGASDVSKAYLEKFTAACEDRKEQLKAIDWYDAKLVEAYYKFFADSKTVHEGGFFYADVSGQSKGDWFRYANISKEPPATSIVGAQEQWKTAIRKYNSLYVPGWVDNLG